MKLSCETVNGLSALREGKKRRVQNVAMIVNKRTARMQLLPTFLNNGTKVFERTGMRDCPQEP